MHVPGVPGPFGRQFRHCRAHWCRLPSYSRFGRNGLHTDFKGHLKRVFTVWVAHLFTWLGVGIGRAFELVEWGATIALLWGMGRVLGLYLKKHIGRQVAFLVFLVMPSMFMLQFSADNWQVFVWDTAAMALTTWGIYALLLQRWYLMLGVMALASFNRETALLFPALFVAMYVDRRTWWKVAGYAATLVGIYAICQWLIGLSLADNEIFYDYLVAGTSIQANWGGKPTWRILHNFDWLNASKGRYLVILGTMGCLPVWFMCMMKRLPGYFRRFGLVAWCYAWLVMLTGNVYEPRIFEEIVVIMFIPVALGVLDEMSNGRRGEERRGEDERSASS